MAGTAKKGNIVRSIQRVREAVKRLHDNGIAVVGAFVLGNDEDDADIFDFPRDWDKFNFVNVTYRPMKMSVDTLQEGFFRLIDETTKLSTSLGRAWKTFRMSRDPRSAVLSFNWNRGFHGNNQIHKVQNRPEEKAVGKLPARPVHET